MTPYHNSLIIAELPVLVVYGGDDYVKEGECQVVDLLKWWRCDQFVKYPLEARFIAGGLLDKTPVVCGGYLYLNGKRSSSKQCFMYDHDAHLWKLHAYLHTGRYFHAALVVGDKLWITGGEGGGDLRSTEYVFANKSVIKGPYLPWSRSRHCMADLLDGRYMFIGGYSKTVDIYDSSQSSFTRGPNLLSERTNSACTVFRSPMHGNRPIVIVAGGYSGERSVEVLDYTNKAAKWERCK